MGENGELLGIARALLGLLRCNMICVSLLILDLGVITNENHVQPGNLSVVLCNSTNKKCLGKKDAKGKFLQSSRVRIRKSLGFACMSRLSFS